LLFVSANALQQETVKVKTYLIQFESQEKIDPVEYYQVSNLILNFQWEPEGLYLITRFSAQKNDLIKLIEQANPDVKYIIDDPKVRDLPKRMFSKL